jgi:hypothetical protein
MLEHLQSEKVIRKMILKICGLTISGILKQLATHASDRTTSGYMLIKHNIPGKI